MRIAAGVHRVRAVRPLHLSFVGRMRLGARRRRKHGQQDRQRRHGEQEQQLAVHGRQTRADGPRLQAHGRRQLLDLTLPAHAVAPSRGKWRIDKCPLLTGQGAQGREAPLANVAFGNTAWPAFGHLSRPSYHTHSKRPRRALLRCHAHSRNPLAARIRLLVRVARVRKGSRQGARRAPILGTALVASATGHQPATLTQRSLSEGVGELRVAASRHRVTRVHGWHNATSTPRSALNQNRSYDELAVALASYLSGMFQVHANERT